MKPYRLINSLELHQLQEHVENVLDCWNNKYSLIPLIPQVSLPPKGYVIKSTSKILEMDRSLAVMEDDYPGLVNQALFGENKPCFNEVSNKLFLLLLNQLFDVTQCVINENQPLNHHWIYPGSTCLLLTLSVNQNKITLVLNPEWVYRALPSHQNKNAQLHSLNEALIDHPVCLSLELMPVHLPIQQLVNLQVGDVIATDHPITAPLKLIQEDQLITTADLGQLSQQKSIILRGTHEHYS